MKQVGDPDVWHLINPDHLWVVDKLILARRLGYLCGPAGVPVPKPGQYVVRPCVNFFMMSRGASVEHLTEHSVLEPGYFWCEKFEGRHLSFDYQFGQQVLAVEGVREGTRLDRFSRWEKVNDQFALPPLLTAIAAKEPEFNVEVIGDKVIEVHFRLNDDFLNHNNDVIIPVWKDQFYPSACGDRIGFILK